MLLVPDDNGDHRSNPTQAEQRRRVGPLRDLRSQWATDPDRVFPIFAAWNNAFDHRPP